MSDSPASGDPAGTRAGDWFDAARLGMFIHWSHCSTRGWELSWPLVGGTFNLPHCQDIPAEEYHANAPSFAPNAGIAAEWARAAKRAGMGYAVLTTKHHDGFALFDTALSEHSAPRVCGRDLVREYVDAMRAEGLRVGFYYSLSDWHHADYPAFVDSARPYRFGRQQQPTPGQWERYLAFLFGQIRELLTNYGQVDLLWFDGGWERSEEQWRSRELEALIRELQPGIVINDRLPGVADYTTPEQFVPARPPEGRWETCETMNESWGWNPADADLKTPRQLVHTLCEVAGRGGNLLLNVGPKGDGHLPPEQALRLEALGAWMRRNAESIVGTSPGLEPWQWYGPSTRRGSTVYLHLLSRPYDTVTVRGVKVRSVQSVREVATGRELAWRPRIAILDQLINPDPEGELTIAVPTELVDEFATVIAVEFAP